MMTLWLALLSLVQLASIAYLLVQHLRNRGLDRREADLRMAERIQHVVDLASQSIVRRDADVMRAVGTLIDSLDGDP